MNIAIAGYGLEGRASNEYWSSKPGVNITIVDEKSISDAPLDTAVITGEGAFARLKGFGMVVRTAGLAPDKIVTDGKIWSATNEFFASSPAEIIGVTGSKGKGTTSSLITAILQAAGRKVWLLGNIGEPALASLSQIAPTDIVVYELSSFQLWDLQQSPQTAVVLMIEQDHLDVHYDMADYVQAKAQITRHQTTADTLIYNATNSYAVEIAEGSAAGTKIGYQNEATAHVKGGNFYYGSQLICSVDALQITGAHNQDNACAAIDAVWKYTQDSAVIEAGLRSFKGLPHRLAFVATVNDVDYYDDSIATTPTSAIAGLRAFANRSKVIILGGSSKGSDFTELATELTKHDVQAILIGDEAGVIAAACDQVGFSNYEILVESADASETIAQAFTKRAAQLAKPGGVVLLSPAAASFGLFNNYNDRGEQFIAAVKNL